MNSLTLIEVALDQIIIFLDFPLPFFLAFRLSIQRLILLTFSANSFFLMNGLFLVVSFLFRLQFVPHLPNLFGYLGYPVALKGLFDDWVYVLSIEEKCAHWFFRRLRFEGFFSGHCCSQIFKYSRQMYS